MNGYTDSFPGREITVAGRNYLYFGGTSYLGLQTNRDFQDLFIQNVRKYGTNYGASRKSNIKISIFNKVEASLASIVGSEACTTLSSGYLAGQLVARHFGNDKYECFHAPNTHSALFQKGTTPFENFTNLFLAIKASNKTKIPVLFLDSIDTVAASYPDFKGLQDLPLGEIILVVDDSHGIGIMGKKGGGSHQIIQKMRPKETLVCCSLGKGYGIQAGAVFGTNARIEELTNTDFFGGASPAAPAALAALSEGHLIYQEQRALLRKNLKLFLNKTRILKRFRFIQDHPVFIFENAELAHTLERNGILITNFKYPNDEGVLMSRIVISAAHTKEDIEFLTSVLNSYKN